MYLYVELWTPTENWHDLSPAEREEYFGTVGAEMEGLAEQGIEPVGFAINDEATDRRVDHHYLAAWTMPSEEHAGTLEASISEAGWYDYFDQVNARGELLSPEEALGDMIDL